MTCLHFQASPTKSEKLGIGYLDPAVHFDLTCYCVHVYIYVPQVVFILNHIIIYVLYCVCFIPMLIKNRRTEKKNCDEF